MWFFCQCVRWSFGIAAWTIMIMFWVFVAMIVMGFAALGILVGLITLGHYGWKSKFRRAKVQYASEEIRKPIPWAPFVNPSLHKPRCKD